MPENVLTNGRMRFNDTKEEDYASVSIELFPNIVDLSDVHCPICLVMSFKTSAPNRNDNVTMYNNSRSICERKQYYL